MYNILILTIAISSTFVHSYSFLSFAVNEISWKSRHICFSLCNFLSCKFNHTGSTDPNHNCKSWRYQVVTCGDLVGCTMCRDSHCRWSASFSRVLMDLIRAVDLAFDHLVLKLYYDDPTQKLFQGLPQFGSTCKNDKAVIATTFFFLHLCLHAVNRKSVHVMHCAQYFWWSMLWPTSISGISVTT